MQLSRVKFTCISPEVGAHLPLSWKMNLAGGSAMGGADMVKSAKAVFSSSYLHSP